MHCQRCKTPLRLDGSLQSLTPAALNLLTTEDDHEYGAGQARSDRPLYDAQQKQTYEEAARQSKKPTFRQATPSVSSGAHRRDASAMSFVMLGDSQIGLPPPQNVQTQGRKDDAAKHHPNGQADLLSHQMETSTRLFEILSARSDIDHPICVECTQTLIEGLERRLAATRKECDIFAGYLKNLQADAPTEEERAQIEAELRNAKEKETKAMLELENLETEQANLERELALLDEEALQLDQEEEDFWREQNAFFQQKKELDDQKASVDLSYEHDCRQLERLQRTNVYNDTFCISHDGYFGTINGLRLGRVSRSATVDWTEVNAAWGYALLLLSTISSKLGYTLRGYRLNPLGSTSTIDKIEGPNQRTTGNAPRPASATATYPLYHSSELPISMGFFNRNFDNAMIAFLDCLKQIAVHVERTTRGSRSGRADGLSIPYEISKDKVNDCSIKLSGFGGDESFTKACKYTLTCLKFLLAHASNVGSSQQERG